MIRLPVVMAHSPSVRWRFGLFEFDEQALELVKAGRVVSVRPQPLKILARLLAQPGVLVTREDLQRSLWGDDTFVDFEQGVNHAIRELRAVLGDAAESPRFIQTLPRRGYRFIAPLERIPDGPAGGRTLPVRDGSPVVRQPQGAPQDSPGPSAAIVRTPRLLRPRLAWLVVMGCLLVIAVAATYFGPRARDVGAVAVVPALAVRPFSAPADPALGAGIAHAISTRLGEQRILAVRPEASAESAIGGTATPWPAGVTHVLDGEITVSGTEITAVARLRDVAGATVWSDQIHARADEWFSLEDVIAERVVMALHLRLAAADQERLRRRYTNNSAAYGDYVRGRAALVRYTPQGTRAAIAAFEHALQRDPAYALARAGLAMACADMYLRFAPAGEVEYWGERAEMEARAALDLDGNLAEAHLARAAVARKREFDWKLTVTEGKRALALNPSLDQARFFVAAAYYHNGYMEEALIETEKGRGLHGADAIEPIRIEALVAFFSGDFAPARARLEDVSRRSSQAIGDTYLALAYYYSGSAERGRTLLESLAESKSASTAARAGAALAGLLAAAGDAPGARREIERVLARGYRDHHVAYSLGAAYAQLGDVGAARRWLKTAADTGFACPPFYERDPLLTPLRKRSDFREILDYVRSRRELPVT